jgi:gamma-glutamyltranspeptidase / glutathione hydrolase
MSMYTISCGNKLTAEAAKHAMDKGGNAFDGVVAASFASTVTEPMLTSLAGGGIGVLGFPDGRASAIDFLTNFPAADSPVPPVKKVVNFGDETQVFYLGYGSLGVPGSLDGLLHIYRKYCSLELAELLAPSIEYARGHKLERLQARVLKILEPFCVLTPEASKVFAPKGILLTENQAIRNRDLAVFLAKLAKDEDDALEHFRSQFEKTIKGKNSTLAPEDAYNYIALEREPVSISYLRHKISFAPPPSAGGLLVAHALKYMERWEVGAMGHNSPMHISLLAEAMRHCDSARTREFFKGVIHDKDFWKRFLKKPDRLGGTTHISILDSDGNSASITTSNGQGSGIMVEGTGIMLNNFAAEPDLMQYREVYKPGERITSMMSPSIISEGKNVFAALGSGGSSRIRSAVLQTTSNLLDFRMSPQEATDASRVHYEAGLLQAEAGINCEPLKKKFKINQWSGQNLYFGGVHVAARDSGGGDRRRSGAVILG